MNSLFSMAFKTAKPLKFVILIVTLFHLADLSCAYRFMPSTSSYAYENNHDSVLKDELMVPPQTNRIAGIQEESSLYNSCSGYSPFYVPQGSCPPPRPMPMRKNHDSALKEEFMVPPQTNRIIGVQEQSNLYNSFSEYSPFYVPQDNAPWNVSVRATMSSYSASAPTSLPVGKDCNNNEYIINWMRKLWPWMMVGSLLGIRVIFHCYSCPSKHHHDQAQAPPAANAPHGPTEELQLSIRVSNGPDDDDHDDDDEKPLPD